MCMNNLENYLSLTNILFQSYTNRKNIFAQQNIILATENCIELIVENK